ncbi:hypothetical protein [Soonwooa purpurea]
MKKSILLLSVLSMMACKKSEDKTSESSSIGKAVDAAQSYSNIATSMDDIQKNIERLKTIKPLSNEEMKSALPETILGLKRTEIRVGDASMMGLVSAEATYSDEANKRIEINIMDGAGETGSAMISMLLIALKAESEKSTAKGFEKTTNFNNVRAIVSEEKEADEVDADIQYILKDRYTVKIDGNGYTLDQLKPVMDAINTSALK